MTEQNADEHDDDHATRAAVLERRIAELEQAHRDRVIRAELKAEALKAGMIDLDGLKLIDTSAVTLDETGEVLGASNLMREARRAKPWLFGLAGSSSTAGVPPSHAPKPRLASDMTYDEWQSARAALLRRR